MDINYASLIKANVYLREKLAGTLEKRGPDNFVFEYNRDYQNTIGVAIGLSLDIKTNCYETKYLHPFFDNLIPEGWLLRHAEKVHKIDKGNRFAILLATGRSPVGAVRVIALDLNGKELLTDPQLIDDDENEELLPLDPPYLNGFCPYCLNIVTGKNDIEKGFHKKCAFSMWGSMRKLHIRLNRADPLDSFRKTIYGASISGAQRKGLFNYGKGVLKSSSNKAHFILKPPGDYDQLPENEHVTMAIAKELGFRVPDICIFESKVGRIFAIKRFDLVSDRQARLEDIAQILRIPSEDKYECSNERVAEVIKMYSDIPKIDLIDFWKRLLFCYLTANADMHLKNWSLLELPNLKGLFCLSPCYDYLNTRLPITKEKIDIGLTLNGKSSKLQWSYFRNFAKDRLGIADKEIEAIRAEIPHWVNVVEKKVSVCCLDKLKKDQYLEIVQIRFKILAA